jgi:hypothetical protein
MYRKFALVVGNYDRLRIEHVTMVAADQTDSKWLERFLIQELLEVIPNHDGPYSNSVCRQTLDAVNLSQPNPGQVIVSHADHHSPVQSCRLIPSDDVNVPPIS